MSFTADGNNDAVMWCATQLRHQVLHDFCRRVTANAGCMPVDAQVRSFGEGRCGLPDKRSGKMRCADPGNNRIPDREKPLRLSLPDGSFS